MDPGQRQVGNERDSDTGGDETLDHLVVVRFEGDVRLKARRAAGAHHMTRTRGILGGLDPVLVAQVPQGEVRLA